MQYSLLRISVAVTQRRAELETVCSLLENEYRRRVLRTLENVSGKVTRSELGREVARTGRRTESPERVEMSLYHVHLPKLADENAIRYDVDAGTVAITEYGERLLLCLDAVESALTSRNELG